MLAVTGCEITTCTYRIKKLFDTGKTVAKFFGLFFCFSVFCPKRFLHADLFCVIITSPGVERPLPLPLPLPFPHGVNMSASPSALVFLGLIANITTPAEIARWAALHFSTLKTFLRFRKTGSPSGRTFSRVLKKLSLGDLQHAFAEFINILLSETFIAATADGKTAKQMKDNNGDPILMLNIFAQSVKLHLAGWPVHGDKTNEPGCLKKHPAEPFTMYPGLKLLTGDALYAQRPLLEALQEYHRTLGGGELFAFAEGSLFWRGQASMQS